MGKQRERVERERVKEKGRREREEGNRWVFIEFDMSQKDVSNKVTAHLFFLSCFHPGNKQHLLKYFLFSEKLNFLNNFQIILLNQILFGFLIMIVQFYVLFHFLYYYFKIYKIIRTLFEIYISICLYISEYISEIKIVQDINNQL